MKERISQCEDREVVLHDAHNFLLIKLKEPTNKPDYLENKSRQNNIRIYNVKEGAEGEDMTLFLKGLLKEQLKINAQHKIIRAHRVAIDQRAENKDRPHSIVVCFQDWDTRQEILKAAWRKKEILLDGTRIYFDQDFTTKIQQERNR